MHPDKETQDVISEGVLLEQLVSTEGWKIVKKMADEVAATLDSYASLPDEFKTATAKIAELERRKNAIALFKALIEKVEGKAQQGIETGASFKKQKSEIDQIYQRSPQS